MTTDAGRAMTQGLDEAREKRDRIIQRAEERQTFIRNPGWGIVKHILPRVFGATAELTPTVMGGMFSRQPGVVPRSVSAGGFGVGTGPGWVPEIKLPGDRTIPLAPALSALASRLSTGQDLGTKFGNIPIPNLGGFAAPKPEAMEAFSQFTRGEESFDETLRAMQQAQEKRPLTEQLALGIIDPVGTALTGGLGVGKAVKAAPTVARGVKALAEPAVRAGKEVVEQLATTPTTRQRVESPYGIYPTGRGQVLENVREAVTDFDIGRLFRRETPAVQKAAKEATERGRLAAEEVAERAKAFTPEQPLLGPKAYDTQTGRLITEPVAGVGEATAREAVQEVVTPAVREVAPALTKEESDRLTFLKRHQEGMAEIEEARQADPKGLKLPAMFRTPDSGYRPSPPPTAARVAENIADATDEVNVAKADLDDAVSSGVASREEIAEYRAALKDARADLREAKKPFDMEAYNKAIATADEYDAQRIADARRTTDEIAELEAKQAAVPAEVAEAVVRQPGGIAGVRHEPFVRAAGRQADVIAEGRDSRAVQLEELDVRVAAEKPVPGVRHEPFVRAAGRQADIIAEGRDSRAVAVQAAETPAVQKAMSWAGIQPEEVAPIGEQIRGAVAEWPGRIVRKGARLVGRGREDARERAEEVRNSWVGEFGSEDDQAIVHGFAGILRNAKRVRRDEIEVQMATERARGVRKGMVEASEVAREGQGTRGQMLSFLRGQASKDSKVRRTLDADEMRVNLGEDGIKRLFDMVDEAGPIGKPMGIDQKKVRLLPWDHYNTWNALDQLVNQGAIPTNRNLNLLNEVFGSGVSGALMRRRESKLGPIGRFVTERTGYKPSELVIDILNMPRANISSVDLSFLLRQGGMLFPSQLREVRSASNLALRAMAAGGEDVTSGLTSAMRNVDNGLTWRKYIETGGLFMHDVTGTMGRVTGAREEAFISSLAGKIFPWVRPSERAYGTFLNKLRWDVMDDMIKKYENALPGGRKLDITNSADVAMLRQTAGYINSMTGRGPLPGSGGDIGRFAAGAMNALMFSPRLFTSRLAAPVQAGRMIAAPGDIRALYRAAVHGDKEALAAYKTMSRTVAAQMATWFITGISILSLVEMYSRINNQVRTDKRWDELTEQEKATAPANVGTDWRSTDFGKAVIGANRFDVWSGYTQIGRAIGQVVSGEAVSASTGSVREVPRSDVLARFVRSKFNPSVSVVQDYNLIPFLQQGEGNYWERFGHGTGFLGEDRDLWADMQKAPIRFDRGIPLVDEESFWTRTMVPLFLRDLSDAIDDEISPLIPEEAVTQINISKEPPSLVAGIAKGTIRALPSLLGVGMTTYRTRDEISREITRDEPRGGRGYLDMPDFQQTQVQEILEAKDAEVGRTRTRGAGARIENISKRQQGDYANLVQQIQTQGLPEREVQDRYHAINTKASEDRQDIFQKEFGERTEKGKRLARQGMGTLESRVQEFYDMLRAAEIQKGREETPLALGPGEYTDVLRIWENQMIDSNDPNNTAAVMWHRMNMYRVEVPREILVRLSSGQQERYQAARWLREKYAAREVREELYQTR
jgi:hypothetical protein